MIKAWVERARHNAWVMGGLVVYGMLASHIAGAMVASAAPLAAVLYFTAALAVLLFASLQIVNLLQPKPDYRTESTHRWMRVAIGLVVAAQLVMALLLMNAFLVTAGLTTSPILLLPMPLSVAKVLLLVTPFAMIAYLVLAHQEMSKLHALAYQAGAANAPWIHGHPVPVVQPVATDPGHVLNPGQANDRTQSTLLQQPPMSSSSSH